jgi:hypothetical protein
MVRNNDGTGSLKVVQSLDYEDQLQRAGFRFRIQVNDKVCSTYACTLCFVTFNNNLSDFPIPILKIVHFLPTSVFSDEILEEFGLHFLTILKILIGLSLKL